MSMIRIVIIYIIIIISSVEMWGRGCLPLVQRLGGGKFVNI